MGDESRWAQLITVRLHLGKEAELPPLFEQMKAAEQPGSGLRRLSYMQDQNDPSRLHILVVLESEEKARARESDPRREEALRDARVVMAEIFDGPPEYPDLAVVDDWAP